MQTQQLYSTAKQFCFTVQFCNKFIVFDCIYFENCTDNTMECPTRPHQKNY